MRWMRRWLMGVDDPRSRASSRLQGGGAALHAVGQVLADLKESRVRPGYRARQRAGDEASGAGAGSAEGRNRERIGLRLPSPGSAWSPAGGRSSRNPESRLPYAVLNAFPKRVPPPVLRTW